MNIYRACRLPSVVLLLLTSGLAQTNPPRLTFDVASIRPSSPNAQGGMIKPLDGGNGYMARNIQVRLMIALMYRIPVRQITGGPEWLDSARYDIEAKGEGSYNVDDLHVMFQNLLADRFGLHFHKEVKQGNVYALTVDASGTKMTANTGQQDYRIPMTPGAANVWTGKRVPLVYLSWWLGQQLQQQERPVVDQTGLPGNYDFKLAFQPVLPPDASVEALPPELRDQPSLFNALHDQLGLNLKAQKGPVEFYVIDKVEKPSDN